jgi:hypothetical protein
VKVVTLIKNVKTLTNSLSAKYIRILAIIAITIRYENFFVCVSIIENIDNRTSIYEIVIKKSCITLLSIIGNMKIKANIDINRKILLSSPKIKPLFFFMSC